MPSHPLKRNPYGRALFPGLLSQSYAFVDKTRFIELLEPVPFAFIIRPQRFGKSVLAHMLQAYYDEAAAGEFEANFAGTCIACRKTPLTGQFRVLRLEFSGLASSSTSPKASSKSSFAISSPSLTAILIRGRTKS